MHEAIFPIGPQHPSLKEPLFLKLFVDGTQVKKAEFNLGYTHRGAEKIIEGKLPNSALHAVQRTCGICSYCHGYAFLNAVEGIGCIVPPRKLNIQRAILAELERIHSHLLWTGVMLHELGLETLFMYFWREREHILDAFDSLTGNRVQHSADLVGTMKMDFTKENVEMIQEKVNKIEENVGNYFDILKKHDIIRARCCKKGTISKKTAKELGLVGPVARASGISFDVRVNASYGAYKELGIKPMIRKEGDSWARTIIRGEEIFESIRVLRKACEIIPLKDEVPKYCPIIKEGVGTGRVEAPRGENFHLVSFDNNRVKRIKIRTPTLANLVVYSRILEGVDITDVPIIVMSLDPCISCMERVAVIKNGKQEVWNSHELSRGKKHD